MTQTHLVFPPRPPAVRAFLGADEIVVDNFAGGGGASTGMALAIGRDPDIAINHDATAIAMHRANHPNTRHYVEDVYRVDPIEACGGRPVGLAWFSPDCTHHSKAKGGKPRKAKIRGLAWVAVRWAAAVHPRIIVLENVEEFRDWGPLVDGAPCPKRKGKTFRAFVRKLERLGYVVDHWLIRACDHGAPTTRRRMFLVARNDGRPIVRPEATHGAGLLPYRTAAEIIDWSIPCPSIFERDRPLADKTLARIARGIRKFVLDNPRPFIVPVSHGGVGRNDIRVHDIDEPLRTITSHGRGSHAVVSPMLVKAKTHGGGGNDAMSAEEPLRTITASKRGEFAVAVPYLVHRSNGERIGQAPRIYDIESPLGTIVAQGQKHALCAAFLAKHYGGHESTSGGSSLDRAIDTITAQDHHSLVAAFLIRYNGQRENEARGQDVNAPLSTLDTSNRFGLATITIDGELYEIVDIGMRMLTPRELFNAQGFPPNYLIDGFTKTAQIRMCGNSVSPPPCTATVRAQLEAA